jgi:hypothetical protein
MKAQIPPSYEAAMYFTDYPATINEHLRKRDVAMSACVTILTTKRLF